MMVNKFLTCPTCIYHAAFTIKYAELTVEETYKGQSYILAQLHLRKAVLYITTIVAEIFILSGRQ